MVCYLCHSFYVGKMNHECEVKKLMGQKLGCLKKYIFASLSFMIVGYVLIFMAATPFFSMSTAAMTLLIPEHFPSFTEELRSTFDDDLILDDDRSEIPISEIELPVFGTHYAEVRSARIGLQAPVFWGDSYDILRYGVGHYIGSSMPGFNRLILLAGHNVTHFLPLQDIEVGDTVELVTNYGRYVYQVEALRVLKNDDESAVDFALEEEWLVMYTCYPFTISGIPNERLFVYAQRIEGPDVNYRID